MGAGPGRCSMSDSGNDRPLKLKEVAERLGGVCERTVRRLVQRGELPGTVKVAGCVCLFESDVQAYLERLKRGRRR